MMKIYICSDHAGFELKEKLKKSLQDKGYLVEDKGSFSFNAEDDYPDFMIPVAQAVAASSDVRGIVIGKSGQGEAMVCNRIKGVRAVVYYAKNLDIVRLSREHNDANILSIGAGFLSFDEACEAVELWLNTSFSGDARHMRRLNKFN